MTTADLVALLRAHPAAALEAVKQAKIAGPRQPDYLSNPVWTQSSRLSIHGEKVGTALIPRTNFHRRYGDPPDAEYIAQQDQKLIDEGWVLL